MVKFLKVKKKIASFKANLTLNVKVKVTNFQTSLRFLDFINKQFKLAAKIPNGSKVGTFTRNHTKFLSFNANLTFQGHGHMFSNPSEIF